jgi:hypothetical protein
MIKHHSTWVCALGGVFALALAGCERPQTIEGGKKADAKAWEASNSPYMAGSWKAGDQASWDEQMRTRAQSQNEYLRAPK